MKNNLKLKPALIFTLFFVIALFSFQNSNAQYARLEKTNLYYYNGAALQGGGPWAYEEIISWDYYIRFYADADCTVPLAVNHNVSASLNLRQYEDEVLNYAGEYTLDGAASSGDTQIFLGNVMQQDLCYHLYTGTAYGLQTVLNGTFVTGATLVSQIVETSH